MLKMLILPRQARDTHRESTQKSVPCSCNRICWPIRRQRWRFLNLASPLLSSIRMHRGLVRKTHIWLLRHFYAKKIILPRQARDEHRESTQKRKMRFPAQRCRRFVSSQLCAPWVDYMRKAGARRPPRSLIHPGATTWSLDSTLSSAASRKTLVM